MPANPSSGNGISLNPSEVAFCILETSPKNRAGEFIPIKYKLPFESKSIIDGYLAGTLNISKDSVDWLKRHIALFWSVNQTFPPVPSSFTVHDIDHEGTAVKGSERVGHDGISYSENVPAALS
jgi:hypothetical protein